MSRERVLFCRKEEPCAAYIARLFLAYIAARCAAYDFLFARNARIFAVSRQKPQKFAQFWQRTQKFVPFAAKCTKTRAYFSKNFFNVSKILCPGFNSACAHGSLGAILGKVREHFAFMACFRGKCERILLSWRDFGESALAHGSLGAILGKMRVREGATARFGGKCAFIMAIGAKIDRSV